MGIVSRIKDRFTKTDNALPVGYPRVTTRISRDEDQIGWQEINAMLRSVSAIAAKFPFQVYQYLDDLFLVDPYMAKYHQTTIALGNTGHQIEIVAENENKAKAAIAVANDLAARCYPLGGGMDGLTNGLLGQLARSGGLCVEWVPNKQLTQVERGYIVPIKTLRFRRDAKNEIELCQEIAGQLVRLNPIQTAFHAVYQRDGNPYPIPPAISALESAAQHRKIIQSIGEWLEKLSSLGVLLAKVQSPPREPSETQEEYDAKARTYLEAIASSITENFTTGMGISYDNIDFAFQNTNAGAQGAQDILQIVLQGLFASMQRDPIFFGWNFNSTETFASVVYEEMQQGLEMFRLGVKRALEHGHRLNLALNGLGDTSISVRFGLYGSLDAFRDAQASQMNAQAVVTQLDSGIITPEEARKMLGHDDMGANANAFIASFSSGAKRYELTHSPEKRIWVVDNLDKGNLEIDQIVSEYLDWLQAHFRFAGEKAVRALISQVRGFRFNDPEAAAQKLLETFIKYSEGNIDAEAAAKIAQQHYNSVFESAKREFSTSVLAESKAIVGTNPFGFWDTRAIEYLSQKVDRFYVSKYVSEAPARQDEIKNFMVKNFLKGGMAPSDPESLGMFQREFGALTNKIGIQAARTIVDTGVSRARNWSHVLSLREYGITEYRVSGPVDSLTCRYCHAMVGRVFATQKDVQYIEQVIESGEEDIGQIKAHNIKNRFPGEDGIKGLEKATSERIQETGVAAPPYHPNCRHRIVASQR